MQMNVVMQTLQYVLALHYNNSTSYKNRDDTRGYFESLTQGFQVGSPNTSCPFSPGCFDLRYPWKSDERPVALPPNSLKVIQPKLILYVGEKSKELNIFEIEKIRKTGINSKSRLVVLTHGFLHSGSTDLMNSIVSSFLEMGRRRDSRLCVMVLDWKFGARIPYAQAVANTRIVGLFLGYILELLSELSGLQMNNVHLIGHSLGAHLVGYAGHFVRQIHGKPLVGRITGMDPAGPYFKGTPVEVRLDSSDAHLVLNIHTGSTALLSPLPESLGITESSGHFDFYPDGGAFQKGCKKSPPSLDPAEAVVRTMSFVACSHEKPFVYISNSLDDTCKYIGVECDSWESYRKGKCWDCRKRDCYTMGYSIEKVPLSGNTDLEIPSAHKKMFLSTPVASSCGVQIRVQIRLSENQKKISIERKVKIKLFLRGSENHNALSPPNSFGNIRIRPNMTLQWVEAIPNPGELESLLFTFRTPRHLFRMGSKDPLSMNVHLIQVDVLHNFESVIFPACDTPIQETENKFIRRESTCDQTSKTKMSEEFE